jgi:adenine phosphoribosyltransferase
MSIKERIRTIPDHPKPGVQFRDITTLLQDPEGLRLTVDELVARYEGVRIDKVVGVEARGFIVGGALAHQIRAGFVPARKQGKLPWNTIGQDYELEYGSDRVEMHTDAIAEGEKVLLVDDLIATGGTALATLEMILRSGGDIVGCCFVIDLPDLGGSRRIAERGFAVTSLCSFEGE